MITLTDVAKVPAEITRLEGLIAEDEARIVQFRENHDNYSRTRNAYAGIALKSERIEALKAFAATA